MPGPGLTQQPPPLRPPQQLLGPGLPPAEAGPSRPATIGMAVLAWLPSSLSWRPGIIRAIDASSRQFCIRFSDGAQPAVLWSPKVRPLPSPQAAPPLPAPSLPMWSPRHVCPSRPASPCSSDRSTPSPALAGSSCLFPRGLDGGGVGCPGGGLVPGSPSGGLHGPGGSPSLPLLAPVVLQEGLRLGGSGGGLVLAGASVGVGGSGRGLALPQLGPPGPGFVSSGGSPGGSSGLPCGAVGGGPLGGAGVSAAPSGAAAPPSSPWLSSPLAGALRTLLDEEGVSPSRLAAAGLSMDSVVSHFHHSFRRLWSSSQFAARVSEIPKKLSRSVKQYAVALGCSSSYPSTNLTPRCRKHPSSSELSLDPAPPPPPQSAMGAPSGAASAPPSSPPPPGKRRRQVPIAGCSPQTGAAPGRPQSAGARRGGQP